MNEISIYVHIPFCERKCSYCAFNSFCAKNDLIDEYIDSLCDEIRERKCDKIVKTIYIGGGTPSILSVEQLSNVVRAIFDNFKVDPYAEFTIEANPNSITEEKLRAYKDLKINRISIGVQSLSDKSLKKIGRLHDKKTALEKIDLAKKYFNNVSADLIVGLEGESGKDLKSYAKQLLAHKVKHISCYLLEVYPQTKMGQMVKQKKYFPLSDDEQIDTFNKLSNYLVDNKMMRYEISNFAFDGFESKHNLNYWKRGEYLGFGISAHSFEGNRRYKNAETFEEYKKRQTSEEILTNQEICEEEIMLSLRCNLGLDLKKLENYGKDLTENQYFVQYLSQGILLREGDRVYLNSAFYHISNTIISNLI